MNPSELLNRIAVTLRQDIGPAVGDEFAKTQAFMAAVVLKKLADQLAQASRDDAATLTDVAALLADLRLPAASMPVPLQAAIVALDGVHDAAEAKQRLCALIELLYAHRPDLGSARFDAVLGRVRRCLRADIDRQLAYAT